MQASCISCPLHWVVLSWVEWVWIKVRTDDDVWIVELTISVNTTNSHKWVLVKFRLHSIVSKIAPIIKFIHEHRPQNKAGTFRSQGWWNLCSTTNQKLLLTKSFKSWEGAIYFLVAEHRDITLIARPNAQMQLSVHVVLFNWTCFVFQPSIFWIRQLDQTSQSIKRNNLVDTKDQ